MQVEISSLTTSLWVMVVCEYIWWAVVVVICSFKYDRTRNKYSLALSPAQSVVRSGRPGRHEIGKPLAASDSARKQGSRSGPPNTDNSTLQFCYNNWVGFCISIFVKSRIRRLYNADYKRVQRCMEMKVQGLHRS